MAIDFTLTEKQQEIQESAREFARTTSRRSPTGSTRNPIR